MEEVDTQLGICVNTDQAEWAAEEAYEDYRDSQEYGRGEFEWNVVRKECKG